MEKVFEVLENDHAHLTELISEILVESDEDQLDHLFEQFLEDVEGHMEREEEFLYPHLEKNEATMVLVQDAYEEHDRSRQLLDALSEMALTNPRWRSLLQELNDQLGIHIRFEEHQVFPRLHSLFPPDLLEEIFVRMTGKKPS